LKRQGKDKLTNQEIDDILDEITNNKQEIYREKALKLYDVEIPQGEVPKRLMQKAYLTFSTAHVPR
jgi:hypothetical protein